MSEKDRHVAATWEMILGNCGDWWKSDRIYAGTLAPSNISLRHAAKKVTRCGGSLVEIAGRSLVGSSWSACQCVIESWL